MTFWPLTNSDVPIDQTWLSNKLLEQGCVKESVIEEVYGRYGDLIKQFEVSLSHMLNYILWPNHIQWQPVTDHTVYRTRPFRREGFDSSVIMHFPGVMWLWHFLYCFGPHPVSNPRMYTFVVSWAFILGTASQTGDADSSQAPGLTSGLQGSVNVHHGALWLVPQ